jgi:hypothetical protein
MTNSDFPDDHEPADDGERASLDIRSDDIQTAGAAAAQEETTDAGSGELTEYLARELLLTRQELQTLATQIGDLSDSQIRELRQQLVGIGEQAADAEAAASRTTQEVVKMKQDVGKVLAAGLEDKQEPKGLRLERFRFERAERPEQALAAQRELALWVPWLVDTYNLYDYVFPCWARHDGVAEELAGIYLAWLGAWDTDTRDNSVVVWHEELARFKTRLSDWRGGVNCMQRCALDERLRQQRNQSWRQQVGPQDEAYRLDRTRRIMPAPKPPKPATGADAKKPAAAVAAPVIAGSDN